MARLSVRDRIARLFRRRRRRERIDPFTVQEPWRRFVQDALQARSRFSAVVDQAPKGPLRDRLGEIADRMDTGVHEAWSIAKRGHALADARRRIDLDDIERKLATLDEAASGPGTGTAVGRSLASQRDSAARMDEVIDRTHAELRVLDARLDETVARGVELSARAGADASGLTGLGSDVDDLVTEMEALRLALDETDAAAGAPPGPSQGLPPPGGGA